MIKKIGTYYSLYSRRKRARLFNRYFPNLEGAKILDLGGGNGKLINATLPQCKNITVADILTEDLDEAKNRFNYNTIQLDETGILPFTKGAFDLIFCSSVIEHVTVDKDKMYDYKTNHSFAKAARVRQKLLADEIRAKSDNYYVQTPNKYFIIESHTWLPGAIVFLPRMAQMKVINFFNKFWPKKTAPDWNLLTRSDMQELFPEAEIVAEKSFGLTKSLIAIRNAAL